jgi:hypothetical protein
MRFRRHPLEGGVSRRTRERERSRVPRPGRGSAAAVEAFEEFEGFKEFEYLGNGDAQILSLVPASTGGRAGERGHGDWRSGVRLERRPHPLIPLRSSRARGTPRPPAAPAASPAPVAGRAAVGGRESHLWHRRQQGPTSPSQVGAGRGAFVPLSCLRRPGAGCPLGVAAGRG